MENIFLIGPMGSGKTTIGTRLAHQLGMKFYDTDHEIETRTGVSVNLIFDIEGETGFRKREKQMLKELSSQKGVLIATGGGCVVSSANRDLMHENGLVVYLQTSVNQQLQRLRRDRSRPILQNENKEDKLVELAKVRNSLYEQTAHLVFPGKNRNIDLTVREICQSIHNFRTDTVKQQAETNPFGHKH